MQPTRLDDVHVTILAGGSGTRLWPLSRHDRPKQLLSLAGEASLLRQTVERVLPLVPWQRVYVLTGPDHAASIASELPELPVDNIFVEPSPRGTAPCLGLAALRIRRRAGRGVMVSLHADHVVQDAEAFRRALCASIETAREGYLVTVGIVPDRPETGFGYVQRGELLATRHGLLVHRLALCRKASPRNGARLSWPRATISELGLLYLGAGHHPRRFQCAFARTVCRAADRRRSPRRRRGTLGMDGIQPVTIDVGIMEKATRAAVVPCEMGWSDVGGFGALRMTCCLTIAQDRPCVGRGAMWHR